MNIPYVFKRCTKCGEWKVASNKNFAKMKGGKYGLQCKCKECNKQYREQNKEQIKEYKKRHYEENRDKIKERSKQYRKDNRDKIREYEKQYREQNKERIKKCKKRHYEENRDRILKQHKQYREDNRDKLLEYGEQYREDNRDKLRKQHKQYREQNKDKLRERHKKYYNSPQGQTAHFNARAKRRLREEQQGTGFTPEQWLEMMKYFDFKCAYSGEYIGGNSEYRTIDHIIPLSKGGLNEIWNLVPMYNSYNFSKNDKDMLEWYKQQSFFSEERLRKIYEWQEYAFNKWGKGITKICNGW